LSKKPFLFIQKVTHIKNAGMRRLLSGEPKHNDRNGRKMKVRKRFLPMLLTALVLLINPVGQAVEGVSPSELKGSGERLLYPGGMPFGVKFYTDGLIIVGFTDVPCEGMNHKPAYDAGLRENDVITKVNGNDVKTSGEFLEYMTGEPLEITYERGGEEGNVVFTPVKSAEDGKYKTGMWIRDTTAGIGTVTYIVPETGEFAGLGHGICDPTTGELVNMSRGTVIDVAISGINKGVCGTPGELKGYFKADRTGVLLGNTKCGVFGVLGRIPFDKIPQPALPIGGKDEVKEGPAWIWSTLDDNEVAKYEIEIVGIDRDCGDYRNFQIEVVDEELIEKTGGIVQGMSGSPIVQDGKLVGAVTHVLINDPTKGYGIFIENMLDAAG